MSNSFLGITVFIRSIPPVDIRRGVMFQRTPQSFADQWKRFEEVRISGDFPGVEIGDWYLADIREFPTGEWA